MLEETVEIVSQLISADVDSPLASLDGSGSSIEISSSCSDNFRARSSGVSTLAISLLGLFRYVIFT